MSTLHATVAEPHAFLLAEKLLFVLMVAVSALLFWRRFGVVLGKILAAKKDADFRLAPLGRRVWEFVSEVMFQSKVIKQRPLPGLAAHAAPAGPSLARISWIGFRTIVIREYGRIMRIWGQTLVPSAVTATLYLVIFGSLLGRRINAPGGFDYEQYLVPGLIMMAIITNSYGNVVSSFFGAKFGKHIEELLVSPLPNWLIVAGYTVGGVIRGSLVALIVVARLRETKEHSLILED